MAKECRSCPISVRKCGICENLFTVPAKLRTKYCSDLCAAHAIMARPGNIYTIEGALAHLRYEKGRVRDDRQHRRVIVKPPPPTPPKHVVVNSYRPGILAYTLLYGGTSTFSFNDPRGDERVGRGGGRNARQVGGPNV